MLLRYILFHHQTTTAVSVYAFFFRCVISSFITKPQLIPKSDTKTLGCVISSFITKPQRCELVGQVRHRCVISSFITKPQRLMLVFLKSMCCVISSFITKPQLPVMDSLLNGVALYPLSSPNHNCR